MTIAGEWLVRLAAIDARARGYDEAAGQLEQILDEDLADDVDLCGRCGIREAVCPCLDDPAPAAASPAAGAGESLAAGAIARSLSDAGKAYRDGALSRLLDLGPWDD